MQYVKAATNLLNYYASTNRDEDAECIWRAERETIAYKERNYT